MEDLKTFMETGILELYVLGDLPPDEKVKVEEMMAQSPAIKAEVTEIEKAMEAYAHANAIAPSANQRDKILNSIVTNLGDDRNFTAKPNRQRDIAADERVAEMRKPVIKDNVIAMQPPKATSVFYKYAFAASLALLAASIVALYNMHNQLQQSNTQLVVLASQNQKISKTVNLKEEQLDVFRDTTFKVIHLKPTGKVPNIDMAVAWSPVKKKVIIDMANLNMPKNDQEHQYQLWALVKGKPVDLGVFDKSDIDTAGMKEMKSIGSADAFAVTLEPRGGSVNPTMSELMVLGK